MHKFSVGVDIRGVRHQDGILACAFWFSLGLSSSTLKRQVPVHTYTIDEYQFAY